LEENEQPPEQAVIILDRTACVVSWDAAAERLFGYAESAALGKPFYHFYTHRDGSPIRATAEFVPFRDGAFVGYKITYRDPSRIND
jgi:PAS domain-containing protein